eukprot:m.322354 g.322354  ORF g.322354 m.322354 type:complete len:307 (-) comp55515_c0_seq10:335-1255(-)
MIAALVLPPSADTRAARQSLRCVLGGGPGREHPRQPCPSSRRGGPARLAPLGPASILRTHGPSSVAESRHVLVRPEASRRPMVEPSRCDRVIVASVSVIMVFFLSCSSLSTLLQSRPNACCSDSTHSSSKDDSLFSGSETEEADVNSSSSEEVPPVGMRPHRRPACRASPYGVDRSTRRSSRKRLAETTDSRPQEAAASSSDLASQARLVICDSCNHRCVQRQDPASFVWFRDLAGKDQGAPEAAPFFFFLPFSPFVCSSRLLGNAHCCGFSCRCPARSSELSGLRRGSGRPARAHSRLHVPRVQP